MENFVTEVSMQNNAQSEYTHPCFILAKFENSDITYEVGCAEGEELHFAILLASLEDQNDDLFYAIENLPNGEEILGQFGEVVERLDEAEEEFEEEGPMVHPISVFGSGD